MSLGHTCGFSRHVRSQVLFRLVQDPGNELISSKAKWRTDVWSLVDKWLYVTTLRRNHRVKSTWGNSNVLEQPVAESQGEWMTKNREEFGICSFCMIVAPQVAQAQRAPCEIWHPMVGLMVGSFQCKIFRWMFNKITVMKLVCWTFLFLWAIWAISGTSVWNRSDKR